MSRALLRWIKPPISANVYSGGSLQRLAMVAYSSESQDGVHMTDNCIRRLKELHAQEASRHEAQMLRLRVDSGGCSGFKYEFMLEQKQNAGDRVFEKDGAKLVVDDISYDFVKGATVDYANELIRSAFEVIENPSAIGGCSCKSSFVAKHMVP